MKDRSKRILTFLAVDIERARGEFEEELLEQCGGKKTMGPDVLNVTQN
jgi:hypothetical protein